MFLQNGSRSASPQVMESFASKAELSKLVDGIVESPKLKLVQPAAQKLKEIEATKEQRRLINYQRF